MKTIFNEFAKKSADEIYTKVLEKYVDLRKEEIKMGNMKTKEELLKLYNSELKDLLKEAQKYTFKELPDGFVMPNDYTIEHIIKNFKNEKDFNQEKEKYLDILKKWVNTL